MKNNQETTGGVDVEGGALSASERSIDHLGGVSNPEYDPERVKLVRAIWYFLSLFVLESGWFPLSGVTSWLL